MTDHSNSISRRRFVTLAAAGAVGATALPGQALQAFAPVSPQASPDAWRRLFTMGYLDTGISPFEAADEELAADAFANRRVISADSRSGSPLGGTEGVQIRLSGVKSPAESRLMRRYQRVGVAVSYAPFHDLQFHMLDYRMGEHSSFHETSRLNVPLDSSTGLGIMVETDNGLTSSQIPVRFALNGENGLPRLRRGMYFLAFGSGRPAFGLEWNSLRLLRNDEGVFTLHRPGRDGMREVGFEYIRLDVDGVDQEL